MTQTRAEARRRKRRLLFNDDGDDVKPTAEEFLSTCMNHLIGTQVDTILFCTTRGSTDFLHRTRVAEFNSIGREFLENEGRDCLEVVTEFAHQNGKEMFWSLRMNDVHDAHFPEMLSEFKKAHLDWLYADVSETYGGPSALEYWSRTAMDFAVEEVRNLWLGVIEEVCENYDIDGVELDFGRMPYLFKPGEVAANRHLITEFLQSVRQRMDELGEKRGRPILLAARVAQTLELNLEYGLDVEQALRDDVIDLLIPGFGYTPFLMPVEDWVALGKKHDVPVYPCICNDPALGDAKTSVERFRAAANNFWRAGADGIYLFNAQYLIYSKFDPALADTALHEIGDPATLAGKDKAYAVTIAVVPHVSMNDAYEMPPFIRVLGGVGDVRSGPQAVLSKNGLLAYTIKIADDVSAPAGRVKGLELRVQFKNVADGDAVEATINGQKLDQRPVVDEWAAWYLKAEAVRTGENGFEIRLAERGDGVDEPLSLIYVELWVRY